MRRLAVAVLVVGACATKERATKDEPSAVRADGAATATVDLPDAPPSIDAVAVMTAKECNRCHEGTGITVEIPPEKHCVRCHRDILAGRFEAPPEALAKWKSNIHSLRVVPSLAGVARLQRAYVEAFLLEPYDVRPGLDGRMPRLEVSPDEARAIAAHLVPTEAPAPAPFTDAEVAAGRELYEALGCASCHRFSGAGVAEPSGAATDAIRLATDLRYARDRLQAGVAPAWIRDPSAFGEKEMPRYPQVSDDEARALAAFVLATPLADLPAKAVPARLPVLEREVTWAEVSEKIFHKTCWHCHSTPDYARGDGGPGNSGGFGFAPRGLDLANREGIMAGSFGPDGRRRSIFLPIQADGPSRLVAHLLARQVEDTGEVVPEIRGMPLGLPPLTPEEIQLVETWIAQGRKP